MLRHKGVQRALDKVGTTADLVGVTDKLPEVLTSMTQHLLGNGDVKAITGLGRQLMKVAQRALKEP